MGRQSLILFSAILLFLSSCSDSEEPAYLRLDLQGLPKISRTVYDSVPPCKYLWLTTKSNSEQKPFNATLQLIDVQEPWPPLWYINLPFTDEEALITDVKKLDNGNVAFFLRNPKHSIHVPLLKFFRFKIVPEGYYQMDRNFEIKEIFGTMFMGSHEYKHLADGRRLYSRGGSVKMDLSRFTFKGKKLGENTTVNFEQIEILDKNNRMKLKWNPLDHMDFDEMLLDFHANEIIYSEEDNTISFSRVNSFCLDPEDGNLLISLRRSDVCLKVNIKTGEIIWRLGGVKSNFELKESERFYLQHDFKRISHGPFKGKFSLFNNGCEAFPFAEGIIYDLDEVNFKAKVVARFRQDSDLLSTGQGNFEMLADSFCLINYGTKEENKPHEPDFTLGKLSNIKLIDFFAPPLTTVYRVTCTDEVLIARPVISCERKASGIQLTAHGDFEQFQWSTGQVATQIIVDKPGDYYVTGLKGIGGSPSLFFHISDSTVCSIAEPTNTLTKKPLDFNDYDTEMHLYPFQTIKGKAVCNLLELRFTLTTSPAEK